MKLTMKWSLLALLAVSMGVAACSNKGEEQPAPDDKEQLITATCNATTAAGELSYTKVDSSAVSGIVVGSGSSFVSAISGDGQVMAIAEPEYDTTGRIHLYKRVDKKWQFVAHLIGSGGKAGLNGTAWDIMQGSSLAVSMDGSTIAFGGWQNDNFAGAVWIFESNADKSAWTQKALIKSPGVRFFDKIALSDDGKQLLASGSDRGTKAFVFSKSANWGQTYFFDFDGAEYVRASAINCDGTFAAIQVIMSASPNDYKVHVYRKTGDNWTSVASGLMPADASTNSFFGYAGSFSGDGQRLLLGAYRQEINGNDEGAAWVYQFNGTTFTPLGGMLGNAEYGYTELGRWVQLSKDGKVALVYGAGGSRGAVVVYQERGGQWYEAESLIGNNNTAHFVGLGAMTVEGSRMFVLGTKDGAISSYTYKRN